MPYQIEVDGTVLRITLSGVFNSADLHTLFDAVRAAEAELGHTPHRLTDLSDATGPQVSFADILAIVSRQNATRYRNAIKSAIVAPGPVQFGFARMYQSLASHPQVTVAVFREPGAAEAWLDGAGATPAQ